ncbi:hypothetical protein A4G18_09225 [Pasteurellaceae bacterium Pebbles2]|nr:hypothetical protein [Pasteurellaceae bacterium Pebbles2]
MQITTKVTPVARLRRQPSSAFQVYDLNIIYVFPKDIVYIWVFAPLPPSGTSPRKQGEGNDLFFAYKISLCPQTFSLPFHFRRKEQFFIPPYFRRKEQFFIPLILGERNNSSFPLILGERNNSSLPLIFGERNNSSLPLLAGGAVAKRLRGAFPNYPQKQQRNPFKFYQFFAFVGTYGIRPLRFTF